ncbi:WD-40 repeat protein, partial [Reticulomyxa filosa]
ANGRQKVLFLGYRTLFEMSCDDYNDYSYFGTSKCCGKLDNEKKKKKRKRGKRKAKMAYVITSSTKKKQTEKIIKRITENWLRIFNIKFGWINEFNKIVAQYTKTFRMVKVLQGHLNVINSVSFSPDGKKIVSASRDKTIRIWDIASLRQIQMFAETNEEMFGAKFSSDGKCVAAYSEDNTIRLWDVQSGKEIQTFDCMVSDIYFSPDNQLLISRLINGSVVMWNLETGKRASELEKHSDENRSRMSPDGQFVIANSGKNMIGIMDAMSGEIVQRLIGHGHYVSDMRYSSDGQTIVSCSWDKTIRWWDVASGHEIQILKGHSDWVTKVDVSPDGNCIVSASWDRTIRVWR